MKTKFLIVTAALVLFFFLAVYLLIRTVKNSISRNTATEESAESHSFSIINQD